MIKFPAKGQLISKCPFGVFKSNSKTNLWTERASQDHKIVVVVVVVVAAAVVGNMAALQIEAVASAIEAGVEAVEAAAAAEAVVAAAAVGNAPS